MAAPRNLSLCSYSSTAQQSLQTPDTSSILFPSSPFTPGDNDTTQSFTNEVSSVNSLEELLSISGITNDLTQANGPLKRPSIDGESSIPKRMKFDEPLINASAGQMHPQDHIPSILPHSSLVSFIPSPTTSHQPINSMTPAISGGGGVVLPLPSSHLKLTNSSLSTVPIPTSSSQPNNALADLLPSIERINTAALPGSVSLASINHINTNSKVTRGTVSMTTIPSTSTASGLLSQANNGSVALLVQLYKNYQSTGDTQGMQKVHQQLVTLQSHLTSKALTTLASSVGNLSSSLIHGNNVPSTSLSSSTNIQLPAAGLNNTNMLLSTAGLNGSSMQLPRTGLSSTNMQLSTTGLNSTNIQLPTTGLRSTNMQLSTTGLNSTNIQLPTTGLNSTNIQLPTTGLNSTNIQLPTTGLRSTNMQLSTTGLNSTNIQLPTTGLNSTNIQLPTTGLNSTSVQLPTTGLNSTNIQLPTTGLNSTNIQLPTTGLRSTNMQLSTTGLNSTNIQLPTIGWNNTNIQLPTTGLNSTNIQLPTIGWNNTNIQLPTTGLNSTSVQLPSTGLNSTNVQLPTTGLNSTNIQLPTTGLNSTNIHPPTTGLNSTNIHPPTTGLNNTNIQLPTTGWNSTNIHLPTTGLNSTNIQLPTTGLNSTNIQLPTTGLNSTNIQLPTAGLNSTNIQLPTTGLNSTNIQLPTTGLNSTNIQLPTTGLNSTNIQLPTTGLNSTNIQLPTTGLSSTNVQLLTSGLSTGLNTKLPNAGLSGQPSATSLNKSLNNISNHQSAATLNSTNIQLPSTGLSKQVPAMSLNTITASSNVQPPNASLSSSNIQRTSINSITNPLVTNHTSLITPLKSTNDSSQPSFTSKPTSFNQHNVPKVVPSLPLTTASSASPSIVTHSLAPPSTTTSGLNQLSGLQVTAQTQANVLRAVYSYRLQQIQDFLASMPTGQRPTSTQELRDLLTKHNILSKALPADFIANLTQQSTQQSLPTSSAQSSTVTTTSTNVALETNCAVTTSSPISITTSGAQPPKLPSSSTGSSSSPAPSGPLPGVTLETLKTLCRLPEADLIRIPMPSMLLTVVQYLRANKWTGNSADLPSLIQHAQDAIAKGTFNNTTSPNHAISTVPSSSAQQQLNRLSLNTQKPNTASPLSQYMASVGIKMTSSTTTNITPNTKYSTVNTPLIRTIPQQTFTTSTLSRPVTRFQSKTQQEQAERERLVALQKVLQSSEEARIAFRFQAHIDKLHQQLVSRELHRPFANWQDLILRLLPYHVYREPELPAGAMEKADAVYEGIAGVLLSRSQGLMNQYQQVLLRDEERGSDEGVNLVLQRLWLEGEQERKEEEERQRKEAEQIAAELSAVGGMTNDSILDTDPFFLDSDSYMDDPFLTNFWDEASDELGDNDFSLGIT